MVVVVMVVVLRQRGLLRFATSIPFCSSSSSSSVCVCACAYVRVCACVRA